VGIEIRHLLSGRFLFISACLSTLKTRQWLRNDGRESRRGIWGIVYVPRLLSGTDTDCDADIGSWTEEGFMRNGVDGSRGHGSVWS